MLMVEGRVCEKRVCDRDIGMETGKLGYWNGNWERGRKGTGAILLLKHLSSVVKFCSKVFRKLMEHINYLYSTSLQSKFVQHRVGN